MELTEEELRKLQTDAARYRWLREQHWSSSRVCAVVDPKTAVKLGNYCPSAEHLDKIIDQGIANGL
jgi:hypothetical protein